MKNLIALKEKRAALVNDFRAALAADGDEARTRADALDTEIAGIDADILRHEKLAAMERAAPAETGGEFGREVRSYSLAKALQEAQAGRLTGREAEVHAELSRGREVRGVLVPSDILLNAEVRSQTVGTATAGGNLVATQLAPLADRFRPALMVERMGATVLRGLSGNLDVPNIDASGTTTWVAENGNATRSAATFGKVPMSPNTITAEYRVSRRLMLQSAQAIEDILRRDLGLLLATGLDGAAINGAGGVAPTGLLATVGLEKATTETAFSDTTANLIAALELDDVTGTRGFLTNPTVMRTIRKTKDTQGHVIPASELFHGERFEVSTQVPNDIGTNDDKSALIYGQWDELVIGYWSAVDILVNPYHADVASNGGALIHAFLDADIAARRIKAFAYAEI